MTRVLAAIIPSIEPTPPARVKHLLIPPPARIRQSFGSGFDLYGHA
jgi:hypothetical protein